MYGFIFMFVRVNIIYSIDGNRIRNIHLTKYHNIYRNFDNVKLKKSFFLCCNQMNLANRKMFILIYHLVVVFAVRSFLFLIPPFHHLALLTCAGTDVFKFCSTLFNLKTILCKIYTTWLLWTCLPKPCLLLLVSK